MSERYSTLVFCATQDEAIVLASQIGGLCIGAKYAGSPWKATLGAIKNDGRIYFIDIHRYAYGWKLPFKANVLFTPACVDLEVKHPNLLAQATARVPSPLL